MEPVTLLKVSHYIIIIIIILLEFIFQHKIILGDTEGQ